MNNILIVKYKNIGDILLSSALINEFVRLYPKVKIDYITNSFCKNMIKNHPNVDRVLEFKSFNHLLILREKKYDLAIGLSEGDRTALTILATKAKLKIGFSQKNNILNFVYKKHIERKFSYHAAKVDVQILSLIKHKAKDIMITSYWSKKDEEIVDKKLNNYGLDKKEFVIVHPVSRWMFKCWKSDYFSEVIDYIESKNIKVIVTASPDRIELDEVDKIILKCNSTPINFSGEFNLNSISYLYSKAKLYLGVDTAPMHIAASLNVPVIALFGPSEPGIWGPWDNIEQHEYKAIPKIQKTKLHTIIQNGFGEILKDKNGNKYSTSLYSIEPHTVINEVSYRLDRDDEV